MCIWHRALLTCIVVPAQRYREKSLLTGVGEARTLISFQSRKLHSFNALLRTIGVTSLMTWKHIGMSVSRRGDIIVGSC